IPSSIRSGSTRDHGLNVSRSALAPAAPRCRGRGCCVARRDVARRHDAGAIKPHLSSTLYNSLAYLDRPGSPRSRFFSAGPVVCWRGARSGLAFRGSTGDKRGTTMTPRLGALVLSLAACAGRGAPVTAGVPAEREAAPAPPIDRAAMAERVRDETRRSWAAYA